MEIPGQEQEVEQAPEQAGGGIDQVAAGIGQGIDVLAGAAQEAGAPEEILARFSAIKAEFGELVGMLTGAAQAQEPVGTTGQGGVTAVQSPEGQPVV